MFVLTVTNLLLAQLSYAFATNCNYIIEQQNGVTFNSSDTFTLMDIGLQQCLKECSYYPRCLSVNFNKKQLVCTINSQASSLENVSTEVSPDTIYLEKKQWNPDIAGACKDNTCPYHTKCVTLGSTNYTCVAIECPTPPFLKEATITTAVISKSFGSTLQYSCSDGYIWIAGQVTCIRSGLWQGQGQSIGCLALTPGDCTTDANCSAVVPSAVCVNGACACPALYDYLATLPVCTKGDIITGVTCGSGDAHSSGTHDLTGFAFCEDCKSLYNFGYSTDGVYTIKPGGQNAVDTFCDMENGGWTLFERRYIGDVNFMRYWADFRLFFGSPSGDFWLGLEYIHALTKVNTDIHFDFVLTNDQPFFAEYYNFSVADESQDYMISMLMNFAITPGYEGIPNGGFYAHNNMKFSTLDRDNDISSSAVCSTTRGAWWWHKCYTFGLFMNRITNMCIHMGSEFTPAYVKFKETKMKVRRVE